MIHGGMFLQKESATIDFQANKTPIDNESPF